MNQDDYLKRQKRVAETMDIEGAWELMRLNGAAERPSDEVLEVSLHKARVELVMVDLKYRLESVEWLRARGYTRRGGIPLPPPGIVPV